MIAIIRYAFVESRQIKTHRRRSASVDSGTGAPAILNYSNGGHASSRRAYCSFASHSKSAQHRGHRRRRPHRFASPTAAAEAVATHKSAEIVRAQFGMQFEWGTMVAQLSGCVCVCVQSTTLYVMFDTNSRWWPSSSCAPLFRFSICIRVFARIQCSNCCIPTPLTHHSFIVVCCVHSIRDTANGIRVRAVRTPPSRTMDKGAQRDDVFVVVVRRRLL